MNIIIAILAVIGAGVILGALGGLIIGIVAAIMLNPRRKNR